MSDLNTLLNVWSYIYRMRNRLDLNLLNRLKLILTFDSVADMRLILT